MSHPAAPAPAGEGFISRNPGLTATVFTILVACIFLGAVYRSGTSGHEGGGHDAHGAAAPAHGAATPAAH